MGLQLSASLAHPCSLGRIQPAQLVPCPLLGLRLGQILLPPPVSVNKPGCDEVFRGRAACGPLPRLSCFGSEGRHGTDSEPYQSYQPPMHITAGQHLHTMTVAAGSRMHLPACSGG